MKNLLITLFFLLITSSFFAQEINQFDTNNKRHGIWVKKFDTGHIRYQGEFEHGKEIGTFKFYKNNDSKKAIITKKFNNLDSKAMVTFYNKHGVVLSKGTMKGKTRIGKWLYYHKDGTTVMTEENYSNGKLHGAYKTYFNNKKPTIIANYKNGELEGSFKRYEFRGYIYQDLNYKDGKLEGQATYYNRETGKLYKKGLYENGVKIGVWDFYFNGKKTKSKTIKSKK